MLRPRSFRGLLEHHLDDIAAIVVAHVAHVRANEHEAAPAGHFEILIKSGIGDGAWNEAGSFVGHADCDGRGVDFVLQVDWRRGRQFFVSVVEGVGDGFLHGEADGEPGGLGVAVAFHRVHDVGLNGLDGRGLIDE